MLVNSTTPREGLLQVSLRLFLIGALGHFALTADDAEASRPAFPPAPDGVCSGPDVARTVESYNCYPVDAVTIGATTFVAWYDPSSMVAVLGERPSTEEFKIRFVSQKLGVEEPSFASVAIGVSSDKGMLQLGVYVGSETREAISVMSLRLDGSLPSEGVTVSQNVGGLRGMVYSETLGFIASCSGDSGRLCVLNPNGRQEELVLESPPDRGVLNAAQGSLIVAEGMTEHRGGAPGLFYVWSCAEARCRSVEVVRPNGQRLDAVHELEGGRWLVRTYPSMSLHLLETSQLERGGRVKGGGVGFASATGAPAFGAGALGRLWFLDGGAVVPGDWFLSRLDSEGVQQALLGRFEAPFSGLSLDSTAEWSYEVFINSRAGLRLWTSEPRGLVEAFPSYTRP